MSLSTQYVAPVVMSYDAAVPKLWEGTIDAHREAVRAATLDAVAALIAAHGMAAVTMSQIAKKAGIGRATLYKYFSDLESVVAAWHERQVGRHLEELRAIKQGAGGLTDRLRAVFTAYALIAHRRHGAEL